MMARCQTAAQRTRNRRRLRSIKKQQSKGIRDVNTDRYDRWGRGQGHESRNEHGKGKRADGSGSDPKPEELLAVVDTTAPEVRDLCPGHGELCNGVVVFRLVYVDADTCEDCGCTGSYHLKGIGAYSPLCREHVAEQPGIEAIVKTEDELDSFGVTPVRGDA
jgi:hypothetical protein